jgi:hypothetical protein
MTDQTNSSKDIFPYLCGNCLNLPKPQNSYFNVGLRSNYTFWVAKTSTITNVLRGYCASCQTTCEFEQEDYLTFWHVDTP